MSFLDFCWIMFVPVLVLSSPVFLALLWILARKKNILKDNSLTLAIDRFFNWMIDFPSKAFKYAFPRLGIGGILGILVAGSLDWILTILHLHLEELPLIAAQGAIMGLILMRDWKIQDKL